MSIVNDEKLTELEYDKLSWYRQQQYLWCKKCYHFHRRDLYKGHSCSDVKCYEVTLKIIAVYPVGDNMKGNEEYSQDLAKMICDEITIAGGGVAGYKILN